MTPPRLRSGDRCYCSSGERERHPGGKLKRCVRGRLGAHDHHRLLLSRHRLAHLSHSRFFLEISALRAVLRCVLRSAFRLLFALDLLRGLPALRSLARRLPPNRTEPKNKKHFYSPKPTRSQPQPAQSPDHSSDL